MNSPIRVESHFAITAHQRQVDHWLVATRTCPVLTHRRMLMWQALVRQTPLAIPLCVRFPSQPHQHFLRDFGVMSSAYRTFSVDEPI